MTDHELELRLRDWYRSEIPEDEMAPAALRSSLQAIPVAVPAVWRGGTRGRGFTLLAAAALVGLLAGTAIVGTILLKPPPVPPTTPAVWTTTGRMLNNHVNHTATLLPDGRVLVVGAYDSDGAPASAELYDPSTGSWTATGDMTRGRAEHTATLLPDGRVLVAGGGDSGTARTNTAELYDPSTGSWTATGDMIEARSGHTATLLPDGRVLVAGAGGVEGAASATAELYDPRTGAWTATANMAETHSYHAATLLRDGTVLVAAGTEGATSAELYDPRTGTWTVTGAMIVSRWDATATLLPDGTVLVTGDRNGETSAELYDPGKGTWTATGPMINGRYSRTTATLLADGKVLVTGGATASLDFHEYASTELYDARSGSWTATADMGVGRRSHTATLLPDGSVLVAGGIGPDDAARSAELYLPGAGRLPPAVPSPDATSVDPSALAPSLQPSITPIPGRIVYTRRKTLKNGEEDCTTKTQFGCRRASVFISNDDGSNEREIIPGPSSHVLAASPDGSKLIVSIQEADSDHVYLTDVDGSTRRPLDTHCESGCLGDFAFSFSADGSRLAFMRTRSGKPGPSGEDLVVATMDMASGTVVELESSHDFAGRPGLSPDGARVAFGNHVVDVDGSNLQEIAPANLFTDEQFGGFSPGIAVPQWSPDGSLIAFTSSNDTFPTNPPERNSQRRMDIWVVRPDGTDLQRLTTDTVGSLGTNAPGDFGAAFPTWTRDGHIAFTRYPARDEDLLELWVMDADGSNVKQVDQSNVAALTALGCVACPYPGTTYQELPDPSFAFWIPAR
jgi:Tol biopolymer transport system component